MPRYDFQCQDCDTVVEIKRTIENRNRAPQRCTVQVGVGSDRNSVLCGGKYIRRWTPVPFRVNRE